MLIELRCPRCPCRFCAPADSFSELADRLLYKAGVAALPGTAFGPWGEGFLRFSYANSVANIQVALDAITSLLG